MRELECRVVPATFTVTSTADTAAAGTLRWAVGQANANADADTIVFDSSFDTAQTITLAGTELGITTDVTITGKNST